MIRKIQFLLILSLTTTAFGAFAQSTATTSSPYSRYGLGNLSPTVLPQSIAMGGIGTAINKVSGFNYVNFLNPASYSSINYTVIDAGISSNIISLSKAGEANQTNTSFKFNHLAFAFPISKHSAFAFGLTPYSELGYNYRQKLNNFGTGLPADTNAVNYIYAGDGGLSKFFFGYGFRVGGLALGINGSYIFGNLKETQSTEIPNLYGTLNSRIEESNAVNGLTYDYGVQYNINFSERKHLVLGYSASASSKINTRNTYVVSSYFTETTTGDENVATDSIINRQSAKAKLMLPQINHFGISYQYDGKYLIGADYSIGNWSNLSIAGVNKGLQDSRTLNIGGQITPNAASLSNYFARVDYRFGMILDDTYLRLNNTNIKSWAATAGLGLPLPRNNGAFYKINLAAEYGKRGTISNGLVKENFVNLHLSFTLNDQWFVKYRYE